jgi:hypothetical protein
MIVAKSLKIFSMKKKIATNSTWINSKNKKGGVNKNLEWKANGIV